MPELLESHKDSVNSDHIYHKNIPSPEASSTLSDSVDIIDLTMDSLENIDTKPINDWSCKSELQQDDNKPFDFDFNELNSFAPELCKFELGSDGNGSPCPSDLSSPPSLCEDLSSPSSLCSPTSSDLGLDWNDSFVDLFPSLG